jgi:hypothetical protein
MPYRRREQREPNAVIGCLFGVAFALALGIVVAVVRWLT